MQGEKREAESEFTPYDVALYNGRKQARSTKEEKQAKIIAQYLPPLVLPTEDETEAIIADIQKTVIDCDDQEECPFYLFAPDRACYGLRMADYFVRAEAAWVRVLKQFVDAYREADIEPVHRSDVSNFALDQTTRYLEHIRDAWAKRHKASHIELTEEGFVVKY